jgi:signal transduction histidine kinase
MDTQSQDSLREALDASVRDSLRPISTGLALGFALLAVGYTLALPQAVAPILVSLAGGTAAAFLGVRLLLSRWTVPLRLANLLCAALAGLALLSSLVSLYLASDPKQTVSLLLLVVGAGLAFLSARWLAAVMVAAWAGWGLVAALSPSSPGWLYFGFALLVATALSIVVHIARVRTVRRLNSLRLEVEAQRAELARTLSTTREAQQLAERLNDVGRALTSTLDLTEVLELVLARLAGMVPFDRGSVMLLHGNEVEIVAARGFPAEAQPLQIRVSLLGEDNDLFRQIYLSKKPLSIPDVSLRSDFQHVAGLPRACSWLGVPLTRFGGVIGMLSLTRETPHPFDDDQATLAMAFAGQAAIALENARLYDGVTRAYEQLARLDRTKSDFIRIASHELRTPLTTLRGCSQILADDPTIRQSTYHLELVSGLQSSASRLHEIVESMLDMAKIDSRALRLDPQPLPIQVLLEAVCRKFDKALVERHLTLKLEDMRHLPNLEADREALRKVFYHLIGNAIKYTPDGGAITISGKALPDQTDLSEGGIEIVVSDTGIGIDPRFHSLIFEKFYQTGQIALHSTGKTKFRGGGPGLGLAIVQGIVQAHGGRVWVASPGCDEQVCPGSQFHVILPLRQSKPASGATL